jgi:hypothetical protein
MSQSDNNTHTFSEFNQTSDPNLPQSSQSSRRTKKKKDPPDPSTHNTRTTGTEPLLAKVENPDAIIRQARKEKGKQKAKPQESELAARPLPAASTYETESQTSREQPHQPSLIGEVKFSVASEPLASPLTTTHEDPIEENNVTMQSHEIGEQKQQKTDEMTLMPIDTMAQTSHGQSVVPSVSTLHFDTASLPIPARSLAGQRQPLQPIKLTSTASDFALARVSLPQPNPFLPAPTESEFVKAKGKRTRADTTSPLAKHRDKRRATDDEQSETAASHPTSRAHSRRSSVEESPLLVSINDTLRQLCTQFRKLDYRVQGLEAGFQPVRRDDTATPQPRPDPLVSSASPTPIPTPAADRCFTSDLRSSLDEFVPIDPVRQTEAALQGSRAERLFRAGLTETPTTEKHPAVLSSRIPETPGMLQKPHFPNVTFAKGTTVVPTNSPKHASNPSQIVVVNVLKRFSSTTGIFLDLDSQKFMAEIRTSEHPHYEYGPNSRPPTPLGYEGQWVINKMDPPMWEFNGKRTSASSQQDPHERGAATNAEGATENTLPRYSGRRDNPSRRNNRGEQLGSSSSPGAPNDPNDSSDGDPSRRPPRPPGGPPRRPFNSPDDPDDPGDDESDPDDIYGRPRRPHHRHSAQHRNPVPVVGRGVTKLSASTIGYFDPDRDSAQTYCDQLELLRELFDDASIIAVIPSTLEGRAKDWFASHSMPRAKMRTVEGWIECILEEFTVNPAIARQRAMKREYTREDKSVMEYFYSKCQLCRAENKNISRRDLINEIWMGLPASFRRLLNYHEVIKMSLSDFSHVIRDKDLDFRGVWKRESRDNSRKESRRSRRRDRRSEGKARDDDSSDSDRGRRRKEKRSGKRSASKSKMLGKDSKKTARYQAKRKLNKDFPIPEKLPKEKHVLDKDGNTVERPCRFCNKMHMDYNCDKKPKSYHSMLYDAWNTSDETEQQQSEHEAASEFGPQSLSEEEDNKPYDWTSFHNVYTNTVQEENDPKVPSSLKWVENYRVRELPVGFAVGTGVAYLSAEPAPIKAYLGCDPSSTAELTKGVVDSGGPSIIQKSLVPDEAVILQSPSKPTFGGIGAHRTDTLGYVVLPVYFPNIAAMTGDEKHAQLVKLFIEFQVVEKCLAGYLVGMDAMKAYKMIIDAGRSHVTIGAFSPPIRVPILDGNIYEKAKFDPRVFTTQPVSLKPFSDAWVPIRFSPLKAKREYLLTPIRHVHRVEGTYASCSYAVISNETNHVLVTNPTPRPVHLGSDSIIGAIEPFAGNTPFSYFNLNTIGMAAKTAMSACAAFMTPAAANTYATVHHSSQLAPPIFSSNNLLNTDSPANDSIFNPHVAINDSIFGDKSLNQLLTSADDAIIGNAVMPAPETSYADNVRLPADPKTSIRDNVGTPAQSSSDWWNATNQLTQESQLS